MHAERILHSDSRFIAPSPQELRIRNETTFPRFIEDVEKAYHSVQLVTGGTPRASRCSPIRDLYATSGERRLSEFAWSVCWI